MGKMTLISLQGLQTFLNKIQAWVLEKIGTIDKKIEKQIFQGTKTEVDVAIAQGLVDENTLIVLTDDDDQPIYELCVYEDILALFPEYSA